MTIETKLNIGDQAFFLHANRVCECKIVNIKILVSASKNEIEYLCNDRPDNTISIKVNEANAFATKEELQNSLFD